MFLDALHPGLFLIQVNGDIIKADDAAAPAPDAGEVAKLKKKKKKHMSSPICFQITLHPLLFHSVKQSARLPLPMLPR